MNLHAPARERSGSLPTLVSLIEEPDRAVLAQIPVHDWVDVQEAIAKLAEQAIHSGERIQEWFLKRDLYRMSERAAARRVDEYCSRVEQQVNVHVGEMCSIFYDHVRTPMYWRIRKKIKDPETTDDILSEVQLRIWRHGHRFALTKMFSTWVYTIGENLTKNQYRNTSRRRVLPFNEVINPAISYGSWLSRYAPHNGNGQQTDSSTLQEERETSVRAVIQSLPAHHRRVLELRELEDRKYEEVAEIVGIPLGTVKSRLNRAREHFARAFAQKHPELLPASSAYAP